MVSIIVPDGPGAMETIRTMRIEHLHTDLYTSPATETDVIDCRCLAESRSVYTIRAHSLSRVRSYPRL